jgi:hypothetical protein
MTCIMATAKHAAAALALVLLLVVHATAIPRPGQGTRMNTGSFRRSRPGADTLIAVAGAPDTADVSTSAVKSPDTVAIAGAGSSVNTDNSWDLCYDLNINRTLSFMDVAYWQGRKLAANQFFADMTCYLQWLPLRNVNCDCLNSQKCGGRGQPQCCQNLQLWRAASNWAVASSYVWQGKDTLGDGYVCEWIQTRPVQGYGIMVASVSYSVVTL